MADFFGDRGYLSRRDPPRKHAVRAARINRSVAATAQHHVVGEIGQVGRTDLLARPDPGPVNLKRGANPDGTTDGTGQAGLFPADPLAQLPDARLRRGAGFPLDQMRPLVTEHEGALVHHAELQRAGDLVEDGQVSPRNLVTAGLVPRGRLDGPHHGVEFADLELLPPYVRVKIG